MNKWQLSLLKQEEERGKNGGLVSQGSQDQNEANESNISKTVFQTEMETELNIKLNESET